ncbi:hypothetical protein DFH06DRAFT_1133586 [Mycena polygramma]|nr:hypothetical protein DFH06DRAFT_1133586 [Mycena polygramma]
MPMGIESGVTADGHLRITWLPENPLHVAHEDIQRYAPMGKSALYRSKNTKSFSRLTERIFLPAGREKGENISRSDSFVSPPYYRGVTMACDVVPMVRHPERTVESESSNSDAASPPDEINPQMTLPLVGPSDYVVKMFWRRVSHLTTRTHDENDNWIGGPEIRAWNRDNGTVQ